MKVDFGFFIGVIFALGAILGGTILEGGHIESLLGFPALVIVLGGTIGAVLVHFPAKNCGQAMRDAKNVLKKPSRDAPKLVEEIVALATRARKDGILGLEDASAKASHPLLAKGILMAVDGCDSTVIRETLETVIDLEAEGAENSGKIWEAAGGYAPTIGIIGAVIGLIHVMSDLTDIKKVGEGIAAAFVATIYGVGLANIFFIPLGGRIKTRHQDDARFMELILSGILAIQEGLNPKLVRERLAAYVPHHEKGKKGGGEAKAESE